MIHYNLTVPRYVRYMTMVDKSLHTPMIPLFVAATRAPLKLG